MSTSAGDPKDMKKVINIINIALPLSTDNPIMAVAKTNERNVKKRGRPNATDAAIASLTTGIDTNTYSSFENVWSEGHVPLPTPLKKKS